MTDGDALLAAILADPGDDTVRLVYADWLEENGQPERAEFIRVQIALAQCACRGVGFAIHPKAEIISIGASASLCRRPVCFAIRQRERELKQTIRIPLYAGEQPKAAGLLGAEFERGFAARITCRLPQWLEYGRGIKKLHPLERVNVIGTVPTEVLPEAETVRFWTFYEGNAIFDGGSERHLPSCIFRCLPKRIFRTRADAMDGLSDGCLLWAREELEALNAAGAACPPASSRSAEPTDLTF